MSRNGFFGSVGKARAMALLIAATLVFGCGYAGEQVTISVNGAVATHQTDLTSAINVAEAAAGNTANITINVNNNQQFDVGDSASANRYYGYWLLHGTNDPSTIGTNTPTYTGYGNVTLAGSGATGGKALLDATGTNSSALGILHVAGKIDLSSLAVTGGNLTVTGASTYKELAGGGMTLGANGIGGSIIAPSAIALTNVDVEENKIAAVSADIENAYGGGIATSGVPASAGGSGPYVVSFTNVNLTKNELDIDSGATAASIRGGGARVGYATSFSYNGGMVSKNKVKLTTTATGASVHASGGGLSIDGNLMTAASTVKVDGVTFKENHVTLVGDDATSRGGGLFFSNQDVVDHNLAFSILNSEFTGNTATIESSAGATSSLAYGGAVALQMDSGNVAIDKTEFIGNIAATTKDGAYDGAYGNAYGGAVATKRYTGLAQNAYSTGLLTVSESVFRENEAVASNGNAFGGAIFFNHSALRLTDVSFYDNTASGTNAAGGAIFINTSRPTAPRPSSMDTYLYLKATAGNNVVFSGNTANGKANSIHFGMEDSAAYATLAGLHLDAEAGGSISLLDPISVDMKAKFTIDINPLNQAGAVGDIIWDGENTIKTNGSTSSIRFHNGKLIAGKDFTVNYGDGDGASVSFDTTNDGLFFNIARDKDLALFDFSDTTSSNNLYFNSNAPTKIFATSSTASGRLVYGFDSKKYLLFENVNTNDVDSTNADTYAETYLDYSGTADQWSYITGVRTDVISSTANSAVVDVYATASYRSPFDHAGANTGHARGALYSLVNRKDEDGNYYVGDAEWAAMQRNAAAVQPEMFMQAANVMLDGVWRYANTAIDYGVRSPHRLRMRMEDSYTTRRTYRGAARQAPQPQAAYQAAPQPAPGIQNYQAYPRLMDCYYPGYGFRVWGGYVGEWRNQRDRANYKGYRVDRHGFVLGFNYDFGTVGSIGVYGGYSNADTKAKGYSGKIDSDNGHFGIIGRVTPFTAMQGLSFYADLGYHFSDNDTSRNVGGWGAKGSFDQHAFTIGLGAEYLFRLGFVNLTPQLDLRYTHLNQDSLRESGSSATIARAGGVSSNQFNHRLGVEASYDFLFAGGVVTPALSLGWRHDWGNRKHSSTARYIRDADPLPFRIASTPSSRDSMDIGLAVKALYNISSSTKLGVNVGYNLNLAGKAYTNTLYVGVELGF